MPQPEGHSNGGGTRSEAEEKFYFQGSRMPRGGQEECPGQQDLLDLPSSLHLGWMAYFQTCRIKTTTATETNQTNTQTQTNKQTNRKKTQ